MTFDRDAFRTLLADAVAQWDAEGVQSLCDKLQGHLRKRQTSFPIDDAKQILGLLRHNRYFSQLADIAEALLRNRCVRPIVHQQYAQALIDTGLVHAALRLLEPLTREHDIESKEAAEISGLRGRAYKQLYIDAYMAGGSPLGSDLEQSVREYLHAYHTYPSAYWQGINAASLIRRGDLDGTIADLSKYPSFKALAREVHSLAFDDLLNNTQNAWAHATIAEAAILLQDWRTAAQSLKRYVEHPFSDAFALGGTLRQLTEVLRLDDLGGEPSYLLDILKGGLLQKSGGRLDVTSQELQRRNRSMLSSRLGLEKVLGDTSYLPHQWFLIGLERANAIGKITFRSQNSTGFLIDGGNIHPLYEGQQLFITNNHAMQKQPSLPDIPAYTQVVITFHGDPLRRFRVADVLYESPPHELDFTLATLDAYYEQIGSKWSLGYHPPKHGDRLYVTGHPLGGPLSFSIQDNRCIECNDKKLRYRSPTDPGSSGSPVFDQDWSLVGLHRGGGERLDKLNGQGSHGANEGINFKAIIEHLQEHADQIEKPKLRSHKLNNPTPKTFDSSDLLPGDILLSRGDSSISNAIIGLDAGIYSHAALWTGYHSLEIIESTLPTVRQISFKEFVEHSHYVDVFRYRGIGSTAADSVSRSQEFLGRPYGAVNLLQATLLVAVSSLTQKEWLQLNSLYGGGLFTKKLKQAFTLLRRTHSQQQVTCVELVLESYQRANLPVIIHLDGERRLNLAELVGTFIQFVRQRHASMSNTFESTPTSDIPMHTATPEDIEWLLEYEFEPQNDNGSHTLDLYAPRDEGIDKSNVELEMSPAAIRAKELVVGVDWPMGLVTPRQLQNSPSLAFVRRIHGE